jgi:predicted metal-dependent hydrolase
MTSTAAPSPVQSRTPIGVAINPRNREFDIDAALATDWAGGSPFITACYNSLSITFPAGEKFFIDSVRHFADNIIDPKLQQEIRGFCGQEGFHRREHQHYNESLCRQRGYDLEKLEGRILRRINWVTRVFSPLRRLAATAGLEHITAIFAEQMLGNPRWTANMPPVMRDLWRWHALEETEHKAVAFDVYKAVGGNEPIRKRALMIGSAHLLVHMLRGAIDMLRHDGQLWKWRTLRDAWSFLLGRDGLLRATRPAYMQYFKADFHPWNHGEQRELLQQWQAELGAT